MRISGNEPSSVILSQTKWFQTLKMILSYDILSYPIVGEHGILIATNTTLNSYVG